MKWYFNLHVVRNSNVTRYCMNMTDSYTMERIRIQPNVKKCKFDHSRSSVN